MLITFLDEDLARAFTESLKKGAVLRMKEGEQDDAAFSDGSEVLRRYGMEFLLMVSDHFAWAVGFRENPKKLRTFLTIAEVDPKQVMLQLA